ATFPLSPSSSMCPSLNSRSRGRAAEGLNTTTASAGAATRLMKKAICRVCALLYEHGEIGARLRKHGPINALGRTLDVTQGEPRPRARRAARLSGAGSRRVQ